MKKYQIVFAGVALLAVLFGLVATGQAQFIYPDSIHTEEGGTKLVIPSGSEIQIESGATFDLQSGATTDLSAGGDFDGATLTIDADGDTSIVEASDDVINLTSGAATGYWNVLTGNLKVGNGTPSVSLTGEDAYIEGTFEVDGTSNLAGLATLGGGLTISDGDAVIADLLKLTPQSSIAVTQDSTIAPTGSFQPITAAGAVSTSDVTVAAAGSIVILYNTTSNAVTISDTGHLLLGGDRALGTGDVLIVFSDGTDWREIAFAPN